MLRVCSLAFLLIFSISSFAQQRSSTDLKKEKDRLTREIETLNRSLQKTSGNRRLSQKEISALNREIKLREQKIGTINSQVRLLEDQINTNTQTVHHLQNDLVRLRKQYAELIRFAARNQSSYTSLMFIFSAKDFNQAYLRMKYIGQFNRYRRKQASEIQGTQKQLNIKIGELDKDKKEKNSLLIDQVKEKKSLGLKKDKQSEELQKFTKEEKQIRQKLTTRQAQLKKLDAQIKSAIVREIEAEKRRQEALALAKAKADAEKAERAAAAAKKTNPSAPPSKPVVIEPKPVSKGSAVLAATPESARLSASFAANKGRLPWPVSVGKVSESFGPHTYGVDVQIYNTGIDIETSVGATVQSVFEGEVFSVTSIDGFALVMIRHGEYITVYSHLKSASVSRGEKVSTKQAIGTVSGNQLHFEVRKGVKETNPSAWISR